MAHSVEPAGWVAETDKPSKGPTGLNEHQVHRWTSWRGWTLLTMIAHAQLTVIAAHGHDQHPAPADMIALTCAEVRRPLHRAGRRPVRALACSLT